MIDASSAKKSLKRFVDLVESIMESKDSEQREDALSRLIKYCQENGEMIREAATEETSQLISYLIVDVYKSGSEGLDDLLEVVKSVDPDNPAVGEYEIVSLLGKKDYEGVINLGTSDSKFSNSEIVLEALNKAAKKTRNYGTVVTYLAQCGLFERDLFKEYCELSEDDETSRTIIDSFENLGKDKEAIDFLELLTAVSGNPHFRLALARLYAKSDEKQQLEEVLGKIDPSNVENRDDALDISKIFESISDYGKALLFVNSGLSSNAGDRDLLLQKARMLIMLRREGQAAETLSELVETYPKDDESIRLAGSISYKSDQYKQTLKYIGLLKEMTELELSDYLMLIDSEIKLSLFDEASENLSSAMQKFGASLDLLRYKLNLETTINDRNESYSTAQEILALDPRDTQALYIKFRYLFDQEEFKEVVDGLEEIEDPETKKEFLDIYATSLIYLNRFQNFIKILQENEELAEKGFVLDAVYYRVRDDEKIQQLLDSMKNMKAPKGHAMQIVINKLLGVKPPYEGSAAQLCITSRSFALGYIICTENIDFKEKKKSDDAEAVLASAYFKEISATIDIIEKIYSGGENLSSLSDSPKLLYPLVAALIDTGRNQEARDVLDRSYDSRSNDPFYFYYDSILQLRKGNNGAAKKSLKRATSRLSNNQFLTLEAEILLSDGDLEDVKEALVKLAENGLVKNINFEEIYKYVATEGSYSLGKGLVEALEKYSVDNIWLDRLHRDILINEGDLEGALEYSSRVVNAKKRVFDDIGKQVDLFEKLGMNKQKLAFLLECSGPNESSTIDLWIGDSYYEKKAFQDALEYYKAAQAKGVDSSVIANLPDTLIETEHLEEAAKIIHTLQDPGILRIKLYYGQGNIEGIIHLLQSPEFIKEGEEEKLTFIAEKLWKNKLIREALVNAYRREGYLFLGRLIAGKMIESGDFPSAKDILENMLKNYPSDIDTVAALSEVYVHLGRITDSIELLLNSLKHSKSFEQSMLLVNHLMRIYFEERDYVSLTKFYETNTSFVDPTSIQYVIRSYVAQEEFDHAEDLLGKYEGSLIDRELNSEMLEEIRAKREFSEILIYVRRLLKLEYKAGKTFSMKEALYKAEIPIEKIDAVYDFLKSEQYYSDVNEEKYEILSRDVFQEVAKKTRVESIKDVKINVIFNNLQSRDIIVAKNLYIYIHRCLEILREPKTKDEVYTKLLKIALKDHLRPEPLAVAVNLNIGISDALEVISLMRFMDDMDKKGGR